MKNSATHLINIMEMEFIKIKKHFPLLKTHPNGLKYKEETRVMELQGPCKYIKKEGRFRNVTKPGIIDASVEFAGIVTPLQSNNFCIERKDNSFYVYHYYSYYNLSGDLMYGRWLDTHMPLNTFKNMKTMFRHTIVNYEDTELSIGTAIIRVSFTERVANELRVF